MITNSIIFEDNHLIVLNKRSGDLVQGDKTGDLPLVEKVKLYIKKKFSKSGSVFLGVVHRIDRPTSGVVLFARTSKALRRLNLQFHDKISKKIYIALVSNSFPYDKGSLNHWLVRDSSKNKSKAYEKEVRESKNAILHYKKIQDLENYKVLEIEIITGRHHQIRAQLCKIGYPIMGDVKYGARRSNKDGSIGLHAFKLTVNHPISKKKIEFTALKPKQGIWKDVLFD